MATPHSPPSAGGDGSRYGLRHARCTQAADRRKGPTRREPAYGGQNKTAKCALMLALTVVTALAANWRAGATSTRRSRPHLCRGVGPGKYWVPALLRAQMLATGAATTKPALQTYDHNDLCRQPGAKRSLRKAQARLLKQGKLGTRAGFTATISAPEKTAHPSGESTVVRHEEVVPGRVLRVQIGAHQRLPVPA